MTTRTYYSQEAEFRAQRDRMAFAFVAMLLGVGLGSVLALLFAPQAGRKTRQQITDQVEQAAAQGREVVEQAAAQGREVAEQVTKDVVENANRMRRSH